MTFQNKQNCKGRKLTGGPERWGVEAEVITKGTMESEGRGNGAALCFHYGAGYTTEWRQNS